MEPWKTNMKTPLDIASAHEILLNRLQAGARAYPLGFYTCE